MARTYTDFWNELKGDIPALSPFRAQQCVQRAWRDIRDSRRWSFLVSDGILIAPAAITTGTITTTQWSTNIVGDAAAIAAWGAMILPGSGVDASKRQIRSGAGPYYNITAYDGVGNITIDRAFQETGGAGQSYTVLRCFYDAPATDFLRWVDLTDVINGYRFRKRNLHRTREELDRVDPLRSSQGQPFRVHNYKVNSTSGVPMFELWPHPTAAISYLGYYSRRGSDLAATESLPAAVPDELLMSRARYHAYVWCAANAGRFEELAGANWLSLRSAEDKTYNQLLQKTKTNDEETFLMAWSESEEDEAGFPADANFIQSHDVNRMW